ncbi:hypothetical protein GUJ93_ZPchr0013g36123 [Zizania palustris]|uniref:Uncharacterized protein n=1 Tax=Zizania palustris TaxID=103762 RepID=A0A8J6C056_ZIZPA|nr:hypothetical protein GUJ93_ZPchr0013g36123 [Zizania palustris]
MASGETRSSAFTPQQPSDFDPMVLKENFAAIPVRAWKPVLLTEPYNDETLVSWLKGCRGCCVANMERVDGDPMHAIESIFL